MKNLNPLNHRHIDFYDESVRRKHNPARNSLQLLRPGIDQAYNQYLNEFNNDSLHSLNPMNRSPIEKEYLESCYDQVKDRLYVSIKEIQGDAQRSICQYCGVSRPNSLDHYVPQTEFPEFSIMALNLMLCCSDCNSKKNQTWRENGNAVFINFYSDHIQHRQFVFCDVTLSNVVVTPRYYLRNNGLPIRLFNRIQEHYHRLELYNKYVEASNSIISEIRNEILSSILIMTTPQKRRIIRKRLMSLRNEYGINYWKCALLEGLSNSNQFLTQTSSPHNIGTISWLRHKFTGRV